MTQSSPQNNFHDKQKIMQEIEELQLQGLTALEAVSCWMEERSIPENLVSKIIPTPIIEMIRKEALEDNLLRPSITEINTTADLDFFE